MPKQPRHDVIYILKSKVDTEELKYSLRSVEKNFPHRKVWFIGGQPEGLTPDVRLEHKQVGEDKWSMIRSSMWQAIKDPELTEDFFLFNDDFFVMKPVKGGFINFVDKTLANRIEELREVHPWLNPYGRTVYKANEELKSLGIKQPMNFEVHLPMLFNKELVAKTINQCSSPQMRSIYGNLSGCKVIQHLDVKVYDNDTVPTDPDYLSTNDKTFTDGAVGRYIRETFPNKSRFEK